MKSASPSPVGEVRMSCVSLAFLMQITLRGNQGAAWQSDPTEVGTDPPGGPTFPLGEVLLS